LSVVQQAGAVIIDVQTLGEYQTTIGRIRLTERREGRVVWELVATGRLPQIHTVELRRGENPAVLASVRSGRYEILTPRGVDSFVLEDGKLYLIEVWGEHIDGTPASGVFEFGNAVGPSEGSGSTAQ